MGRVLLGKIEATNMAISRPGDAKPVWTVWSDGTAEVEAEEFSDWTVPEVEAKRHEGEWHIRYQSSKNGIEGYVTIDSDLIEQFYKDCMSRIIDGSLAVKDEG